GLEALEPRSFSFNSPYGACPACDGLGTIARFDPDLIVPDRSRSLADGAIAAFDLLKPREQRSFLEGRFLTSLLERFQLTRDTPLRDWPKRALDAMFGTAGSDDESLIALLERISAETTEARRTALNAFRDPLPCPACGGARLKP